MGIIKTGLPFPDKGHLDALHTYTTIKDIVRAYNMGMASITNVSAAYTIIETDTYVYVTTGAGGVTITLPPATGTGRVITIKKVDAGAGAVTVDGNASETIDGAITVTLAAQYNKTRIQDAGSGIWYVV